MANGVSAVSQSQTATYDSIGLAEDYSSIITNISPEKTPFLSTFKDKENATELTFNWMTEALKPPQENAHLEMEDYVTEKVGGIKRLTNMVQFFKTTGKVSDAMRQVKKLYNQQDEYPRQVELAFKQHALDLEFAIVSNGQQRTESGVTPALTGGLPFFLAEDTIKVTFDSSTNTVTADAAHGLDTGDYVVFHSEGGTLPANVEPDIRYYIRKSSTTPATVFSIYDSMEDAIKDTTGTAMIDIADDGSGDLSILLNNVVDAGNNLFTEADINYAMELAYYRGGNPTWAVMSGLNKRRFSDIVTGKAQKNRNMADKKVVAVTDVYESDFGQITAMSHMMISDKDMYLLDPSMWGHKWFNKPHQVNGLAKKGSYNEFVLESEYGLEATQPLASARICNIKRSRA